MNLNDFARWEAINILRAKFKPYLLVWIKKKRYARSLDLIRSSIFGFLNRTSMKTLFNTNLNLAKEPCIYLLREQKILFLKLLRDSQ